MTIRIPRPIWKALKIAIAERKVRSIQQSVVESLEERIVKIENENNDSGFFTIGWGKIKD